MTYTVSAPITLTNNTLFAGAGTATFNFSGAISGSATLTKGSTSSDTALLTLSGANTYTGATIVNGGTLQAGVATVGTTSGAFGVNSAVTLANNSGATLALNGFNNTIGSLTGGGATGGNVTLGSATLTVGSDNTSPAAYSGVISGTGGLTKSGSGTLTLSGANTYSGVTTINAGTLKLDNAGTTTARLANTTNITVNAGGTLLLASSSGSSTDRINDAATMTLNGGTFNTGGLKEGSTGTAGVGALTLQANSIIDLGVASTTSILHFAASNLAAWTAAKTLTIHDWNGSLSGGGAEELLFGTSSSGLTASQIAEIQFLNPSGLGPGTWGAKILATGEIVPVPEPSTWAGGVLAVVSILSTQRRRLLRFVRSRSGVIR
jgi:autotransporter-associated beta strand protein